MKRLFLLILSFNFCYAFSQQKAFEFILKNMKAQEAAWNNGDIEGYMNYYWNSDSLKFIGKSGITYGWKTTREHYKESYPDKATMGTLTFSDIKLERIERNLVMLTGSWKLVREKDTLSGYYSLFWKRIRGKWLIIIDHTS